METITLEQPMSDNKTLTRKIALEWDGNSSLRKYVSIDDDAAVVLANYDDADLELMGLTSLSLPAAKALSRQKNGSLTMSGLTSLADDIAGEFSRYEGILGLDGLTSLSLAAAQALSKSVQSLYLSGLTSVSDPVAEVLCKCKGRIMLGGLTSLTHSGLAVKLAEKDDELYIPGLTELSDEVATSLSKTRASLLLNGLKSIPNFDLAWKLFLQERDSSYLSSLTSLSADEAAVISSYRGDIYLDNLSVLSEIAAETLSRHEGILGLRGLTSVTDSAAEALSKHNGTVILPQTLSKKVADHFLRRFTGGVHQTSQMPTSHGAIRASELQHGKLYDCKVDSEHGGKENENIIQLAIDATTNRRFVLFGARYIYQKDPEYVHKLIGLDYYFLFMEEYGDSKWNTSIREMFLDQNGVMLQDESNDGCLYDFKETDVIKIGPTS